LKKKDWFIVFLPFVLTWGLDRITKIWAQTIGTHIYHYGPVIIAYKENPGIMLGLFSDLPPIIRVVCLSTGGAFLLFLFGMIQFMMPIKSLILRSGLSILLAGILGNVVDRIIYGYVIDFLIIGNATLSTAVFNIADAIQWVAYLMICYSLIRESEILWPENNRRGRLWINPPYQIRYCMTLIGVGMGFSVISGVFSYTFLKVALTDWKIRGQVSVDKLLWVFVGTFIIVSLIFAFILFILGRRLSHRTVGPIYAFEKFIDELINGKKGQLLKLRTGDEFTHLEQIAIKVQTKFIVNPDNDPPPNLPDDSDSLDSKDSQESVTSIITAQEG